MQAKGYKARTKNGLGFHSDFFGPLPLINTYKHQLPPTYYHINKNLDSMNTSTSQHSSGCESGWTSYFDHVSNSSDDEYSSRGFYTNYQQKGTHDHQQEDEDLSMVSDASSAPPHYSYTSSFSQTKNKSKTKEANRPKKEHTLCLDDTATSPVFSSSKRNVPPKHDHEACPDAHYEGESITKKNFSFFKRGKSGSLLGRKRQ